ncbi:biotin--[acetyl-CoA-carboxylase] ligase [Deinococcus sp. UR1]|uniref:biotin--[acetyl-CoA-carboxylase] ligase n=1 Tax=Deinococcus sp. UR1 TaxID=1704277 RepID=UPI000C1866FC|nr:biotin--[acetyl-CoA-carboxylase] ligase [Deinococcus sp. UR1]PIG97249.1 biotin--[acetyl-CoA-carboxylase] ligase [Deinococcus sp. UR1]
MPDRLLPLLTERPQTGDALGQTLGVNRVTVNTLARHLIEAGVPVQVTRAGYALPPGTPTPHLTPRSGTLGQAMRYHGTVTSTQDSLRAWADHPTHPAPHGAVTVAERQTVGRGRRGRTWDTTHGTLVFSVLLTRSLRGGPLTLADLPLMPLAAGVAVQRAAGVGGLKWPNDLLAPNGRKLAGILLEADLRGEEARRAVLGIGINVTAAPQDAAHLSALHAPGTPEPTRAALLGTLLLELERWLAAPATDILNAWRAANVTLGRPVLIHTHEGPLEGVATDLDAQGSLIVTTAHGPRTVSAGDVQLVGSLAPEPPEPSGSGPAP